MFFRFLYAYEHYERFMRVNIFEYILQLHILIRMLKGGSPLSKAANVLDSDIVVSDFKLQLHYYVQFRTNTLRNLLSLQLWVE